MELSPDARRRYGELYRSELSQEFGTVVLDSLLERRAPMLLRIAMLLAVIDQQWRIDERHIEAGMAWIRYGISSVRFVFAGESKHPISLRVRWAADRISAFLAVRGNASRRDLMIDCFQRHQPASIIDAALAYLIDSAPQRIRVEVRPRAHDGPGRPGTIYHWV